MDPALEKILNQVVAGIPDSYQLFKNTLLDLKGGCSEKQFVNFLSTQTSLVNCDPEALVDMGYYIAESSWILKDVSVFDGDPEADNGKFNADHFVKILLLAAQTNLGAQCAFLHILSSLEYIDDFCELPFNFDVDLSAVTNWLKISKANKEQDETAPDYFNYSDAIISQAGLMCEPDATQAKQLLHASRLTAAKCLLGRLYATDKTLVVNVERSMECYRAAAEKLSSVASYELALCLFHNKKNSNQQPLTDAEYAKAVKLGIMQCELAATLGNSEAQFYLGQSYGRGYGTKINKALVLKYYLCAAKQNEPDALRALAKIYEKGLDDVKKDLVLSIKFYQALSQNYNFTDFATGSLMLLSIEKNGYKTVGVDFNLGFEDLENDDNALRCMITAVEDIEEEYLDEAIYQYTKIIKLRPDAVEAYLNLIRARLKKTGEKNVKLIVEELMRVEKLVEGDNELHHDFKEICSNIAKQIHEGKLSMKHELLGDFYTIVINHKFFPALQDAVYADYYIRRAHSYLCSNQALNAIKDYTTYLVKYNPKSSDVYKYRAMAYDKLGRHVAAQDDRKKAAAIADELSRSKKLNGSKNNKTQQTACESKAPAVPDTSPAFPATSLELKPPSVDTTTSELKPSSTNTHLIELKPPSDNICVNNLKLPQSPANLNDKVELKPSITDVVVHEKTQASVSSSTPAAAVVITSDQEALLVSVETVVTENSKSGDEEKNAAVLRNLNSLMNDSLSVGIELQNTLRKIALLIDVFLKSHNETLAKINIIMQLKDKKKPSQAIQNIFNLAKKLINLMGMIDQQVRNDIADLVKEKPTLSNYRSEDIGPLKNYFFKVKERCNKLAILNAEVEKSRYEGLILSLSSTITNYTRSIKSSEAKSRPENSPDLDSEIVAQVNGECVAKTEAGAQLTNVESKIEAAKSEVQDTPLSHHANGNQVNDMLNNDKRENLPVEHGSEEKHPEQFKNNAKKAAKLKKAEPLLLTEQGQSSLIYPNISEAAVANTDIPESALKTSRAISLMTETPAARLYTLVDIIDSISVPENSDVHQDNSLKHSSLLSLVTSLTSFFKANTQLSAVDNDSAINSSLASIHNNTTHSSAKPKQYNINAKPYIPPPQPLLSDHSARLTVALKANISAGDSTKENEYALFHAQYGRDPSSEDDQEAGNSNEQLATEIDSDITESEERTHIANVVAGVEHILDGEEDDVSYARPDLATNRYSLFYYSFLDVQNDESDTHYIMQRQPVVFRQ